MTLILALLCASGVLALLAGCGAGALEDRARRQARAALEDAPIPTRRKGGVSPFGWH